jgi:enolase-phosphatase E1
MNSKADIKHILVDIEGTTSSIRFVHEVLFPYAKKHLKTFISDNFDRPEVNKILKEVLEINGIQSQDKEEILKESSIVLEYWITEDKKIKQLKELQGLIWEAGYKSGEYYGHIYEDAYKELKKWQKNDYKLYVYSSGSVKAQKLLFAHTKYGDLNSIFADNFDTQIGSKKESDSYTKIAAQIDAEPSSIIFLSDNEDELKAASRAGMQVIHLARPEDDIKLSKNFNSVEKFSEIKL